MAARRPTIGSRVGDLETRVDKLAEEQKGSDRHRLRLSRVVQQLRRDQKDTRERLDRLEAAVRDGLDGVHTKLDEQTAAINEHIDAQGTENRQFVIDNIVELARQWPASAIVAVSAVAALVVAVAADLIAAALHLPHVS